jgi:membrane protein
VVRQSGSCRGNTSSAWYEAMVAADIGEPGPGDSAEEAGAFLANLPHSAAPTVGWLPAGVMPVWACTVCTTHDGSHKLEVNETMELRRAATLLQCAARHWISDNASNTGAALAFYCAFSIAPLLVILLTLAGLFFNEKTAAAQVGLQLTVLYGPATAKILLGAVQSAQRTQGGVATVVSVVTLLIGSTTVLAALQAALAVIWGSDTVAISGIRGWLRTRLLSFGFILTLGFLLLISMTLSAGLASLRARFAAAHPAMIAVISISDTLISLLLVGGLFALIYRYMPTRHLPWRTVAAGGLLTAVLFDAGRWVVGLYLAHSTQPSAYGAASSFAALLLWLYYTSQILLFGAEFTSCLAGLRARD